MTTQGSECGICEELIDGESSGSVCGGYAAICEGCTSEHEYECRDCVSQIRGALDGES